MILLLICAFALGLCIGEFDGSNRGFNEGKKAVIDWVKEHYGTKNKYENI